MSDYIKLPESLSELRSVKRVMSLNTTIRNVDRPEIQNELFVQPFPEPSNELRAKREEIEFKHRQNFAKHFFYEDPFARAGIAVTFDPEGNYNCGRCNKKEGRNDCLIIPIDVNLEAGGCKHWETECAGDREIDTSGNGYTEQQAAYGVAANGSGFGCHRCPFASKAYAADSVGRDLYCGKGDFRVFWNACCELNGAETV